MDQPGAFGSKASGSAIAGGHKHTERCRHPVIKDDLKGAQGNDACAASHILYSIHGFGDRFGTRGTLSDPIKQGKVTVLQSLLHEDVASGETGGLVASTARLLGTTEAVVAAASASRGKRSYEQMNGDLCVGGDISRQRRSDAFNFGIVYDYIHHTNISGERLPDFCSLVEPDKSKTAGWKRPKPWSLHGTEMLLTCSPHVRRGTRTEIARQFLESETMRM